MTKPSSSFTWIINGSWGGNSSSSKGTIFISKAKIYVTGNATLVGGEQTITDKLYTMTVEYFRTTLWENEISFEIHIGETTILSRKPHLSYIKKSQI